MISSEPSWAVIVSVDVSADELLTAGKQAGVAVEMEGAAVAQVCHELHVPFAVIRAISDNANEHAAHDFMGFVKTVAAQYAFHITRRLCRDLAAAPL